MGKGYIYIMTNPMLHGPKGEPVVKIGYADDVEKRRKQLSTTNVPADYRVFATYEVKERLTDQTLHDMIDKLNPELRIKEKTGKGKEKVREFYYMTPEDALNILKAIATISGTKNKIKQNKVLTKEQKEEDKRIKAPFKFSMVGIKPGEIVTFKNHNNIKCKVVDDKRVEYNGEIYPLSKLAQKLLEEVENKKWKSAQGPAFFEYKNKTLLELRLSK